MTPSQLQRTSFDKYPPKARAAALEKLQLLQTIPLPLLVSLLRELSTLDWRFPREIQRLQVQLGWLRSLNPSAKARVLSTFASIAIPTDVASRDWVNDPGGFLEAMTSSLWSSGQIEVFHEAARRYAAEYEAAHPVPKPELPRLLLVVLDHALSTSAVGLPIQPQLQRLGVLLTNLDGTDGTAHLRDHVLQRATQVDEPFAHWSIDGASQPASAHSIASVSYEDLQPTRELLLRRARNVMNSDRSGPEELRSLLAHMSPEETNLGHDVDPVMAHFQLSLLTEGSGTQIFTTTFVQWTVRECLRRAEPLTVFARFTPRQRQQGMNELLSGVTSTGMDLAGSCVDATMGAYYSWLNLQRLTGAEQARMLFWQEGKGTALLIGPGLPAGTTSKAAMTMQQALHLLA